MNSFNAILQSPPASKAAEINWPAARRQRPSFRWSDIWKAPLHDFPIRDEILYRYLPLVPDMEVLEVGPGSGFTAFRLARAVRRMTLVDVSVEVLAELRSQLDHLGNLRFIPADISRPGLPDKLSEKFDVAFGLDVFEYIADPAACLRNLAEVLRPGGELFLSYPNVPPPAGDGVTYFSRTEEIESLLTNAGFSEWKTFVVRFRPLAAGIYRVLHERPLEIYRRMRSGNQDIRPQIYEDTWAFRCRTKMLPYKVPLPAYWAAVEAAMRTSGDLFATEPATDGILGRQLVIRAWR